MYIGRHTCLPWLFESGDHREVPLLAELGGVPHFVVCVGDRRRARRILGELDEAFDVSSWCRERRGDFAAGRVELGVGRTRGVPVMIVETQMGGPPTEIILREVLHESFHPDGARAILRLGSCGTLRLSAGVPGVCVGSFATGWSGAIEQRRRGVLAEPSGGLEPPIVECSKAVLDALIDAATDQIGGGGFEIGGVFSKDSLYAEQNTVFADILRRLACVATEMESATIGPIAASMGVDWGCVLATADVIPDGRSLDPVEYAACERQALEVALEAIVRLDAE